MKQLIVILAVLASGASAEIAKSADKSAENKGKSKVVLQADVWCPFNCKPDSVDPGYMVEIAREAFSKQGMDVDYQVKSWARAISDARDYKQPDGTIINGIIGAATTDAPDFIFPQHSLGRMGNCFYTKPSSKWIYKDGKSLTEVRVGVIEGYTYGGDLDPHVEKWVQESEKKKKAGQKPDLTVQPVPGNMALELNIKKLDGDRIDTFAEEQSVLKTYMFTNKIPENKFRNAGCLAGDDVAIAFSPKEPKAKEYAKLISDTIVAMRKDGRLKKLLEKYGLKDWEAK